jgi:hypothetical protein
VLPLPEPPPPLLHPPTHPSTPPPKPTWLLNTSSLSPGNAGAVTSSAIKPSTSGASSEAHCGMGGRGRARVRSRRPRCSSARLPLQACSLLRAHTSGALGGGAPARTSNSTLTARGPATASMDAARSSSLWRAGARAGGRAGGRGGWARRKRGSGRWIAAPPNRRAQPPGPRLWRPVRARRAQPQGPHPAHLSSSAAAGCARDPPARWTAAVIDASPTLSPGLAALPPLSSSAPRTRGTSGSRSSSRRRPLGSVAWGRAGAGVWGEGVSSRSPPAACWRPAAPAALFLEPLKARRGPKYPTQPPFHTPPPHPLDVGYRNGGQRRRRRRRRGQAAVHGRHARLVEQRAPGGRG